MLRARVCLLLISVFAAGAATALERPAWQLELEQIMAHPDWIGPPVEQPHWSLDSQRIQFSLKRAGSPVRDLWQVAASGQTAAEPVADDARAALDAAEPVFDGERRRALFIRDGDVFLREIDSGRLLRMTASAQSASRVGFSADGRAALWRVGQDWWTHDFAEGLSRPVTDLRAAADPDAEPEADTLRDIQLRLFTQLAREKAERDALRERERELRRADPARPPLPVFLGDKVELVDSRLSPDRRHVVLVTQPKGAERGRVGKMPKYVTESGYEEVEDVRVRVGRNAPQGHGLQLVDLADGSLHELALSALPGIGSDPLAELRKLAGAKPLEGDRRVRVDGIEWNADGSQVAIMLRAIDNKDRWIVAVDFVGKTLQPLHRLTDPAWINWAFNEFGWMPGEPATLWLLSEQSGWSQLYAVQPGGRPQALTSGRWEVADPQWSADGGTAWFRCNRAWPGDWQLCALDRASGEVRELTAVGAVEAFVPSPDQQRIALLVSSSHTPPQLAVIDAAGSALQPLTDTRSADYRARSLPPPEIVQVPSRHGAGVIWGKFYRPAEMQPDRRYPIALFVHGAGYLQNVHTGWPVYFREQMFHHLLTEHGYIVLDLDFRASSGYGRDWRTAIYRQMGHPELEDYLDGIDWLVEERQGDRERVGVYGGSYGGFMAFMALFRAPDAFHAGAALRPVTDWTQYNHQYTSNILNTPDIDPEAFRRSSPIEFAEGLRGQLLISHGMIDDNVFYQDSVRLAQRLIELRKDGWELASYPLERHAYQHPESWYDQYRRVFELFQRTLQPDR
jgi:dipeptidyl aminopeptidase/acylaminoacyl peptidase